MSEEWKYYKTLLPQNKLIIQSTGKAVPIIEINPNLGVIMVKNDVVISAIESQIENRRGGWERSNEVEHHQTIAQKKSNSPKPWREEFGGNQLRIAPQTFGQQRKASVAGAGNDPGASASLVPKPPAGPKAPDSVSETFRPTATKRPN